MNGTVRTKEIVCTIQENGTIRDSSGNIIARLCDRVEFDQLKNVDYPIKGDSISVQSIEPCLCRIVEKFNPDGKIVEKVTDFK